MDFGIVYHFETPHQFWAELEDILSITSETSLAGIDYALQTFVEVCANNHERFLQTNAQLDHASALLLESELFTVHSQRCTDHIVNDAKKNVDPHAQLILYKILLDYGVRQPSFFRNLKKWSPLVPFLMDHILVDIDDNGFAYGAGTSNGVMGMGYPIEARLRTISVFLLYEVCRVQKIDQDDLKLFTEDFINHLFDLVEETRNNPDETLNYGLIRLIVALNEQFMVASLPAPAHHSPPGRPPRHGSPALGGASSPMPGSGRESPSQPQSPTHVPNRVLHVLMRRLGSSKTFGENLIFMLNRAENTPEDLCMQLLVLKLLYLLFTTHATQEYFYTNDLRVLVDVFVRELVDLPDESESLRHTYLRVLHPLLTNTQLRSHPYKRLQIRNVLHSLVAHANIRDITSTTRRLVDRCLKGQWCIALEAEQAALQLNQGESQSVDSGRPSSKSKSAFLPGEDLSTKSAPLTKTLHKSASMTFGDSAGTGGGGATGLSRAPSKKGNAAGLSVKHGMLAGPTPCDTPRSADPASGSRTFHPPERAMSLDDRMNVAVAVVSPTPPPPALSLDSLSIDEQPDLPSSSSAVAVAITAPTPTVERPLIMTLADNNANRPRSGSANGRPPPPRPPRKNSDGTIKAPSTRNNSMGEVSKAGLDVAGLGVPQVFKEGTALRRSAPPTPPPKRRKPPAVPVGGPRKTTTMTTIASSSTGGAAVGLGVPVR